MQPGHQFELFAPPHDPGHTVPASHIRNASVRVGGQLELPMQENVLATRSTTAPPPEKGPEQRLRAGQHPVDTHHGGTYPMFMTGGEIRHQFQALDGDREDEMDYQDSWGPAGGVTIRGTRTATHEGKRLVNKDVMDSDGGKRLAQTRRVFHTGDQIPSLRAPMSKLPETDDDLYTRKLDEAWHDDDAWHEDYDMPMPGAGVAQSISEHGYNWNHPVHLPTGLGGGYNDSSGGTGTFGKYQVLGGHHRIAVMSEEHPRQFMPVQWHGTINEAKGSGNYY